MDRLISEQEVIKVIDSLKANFTCYDSVTLDEVYSHVKAIPPADEDEWVKRSDVLKIVDKRVNEALAEPYKGMTNGEIMKKFFKGVIHHIDGQPYLDYCYENQVNAFTLDWWNSPYKGGQK